MTRRCPVCGTELPEYDGRGRPRVYCSRPCVTVGEEVGRTIAAAKRVGPEALDFVLDRIAKETAP